MVLLLNKSVFSANDKFNFITRYDCPHLEDVVVAVVAVPELAAAALVPQTEHESGPGLHHGAHQPEAELVRVPGAAPRHPLRLRLADSPPVVTRPPHRHGLMERDVEDPHDTDDGVGALHEGVLQADLLPGHRAEEGGGAAGLVEHRDEGGCVGLGQDGEGGGEERANPIRSAVG